MASVQYIGDQSCFKHARLNNPTKEIRVLRVLPGNEDDILACELEVCSFDLEELDIKYYAISYTWGDKVERPIRVNNEVLYVRENCYYALWQFRLHHPGEYVWIDSTCINQESDEEKTNQVQLVSKLLGKRLTSITWVSREVCPSSDILY